MNREQRHIERLKKKRRRHIILLSIFVLAVVATGSIALASFLSTNVYQDEDEFREYADGELKKTQQFNIEGKSKVKYEYGTPISYIVDYSVSGNETVTAFAQQKVDEIKTEYKQHKAAEEKKRAEKYDNPKKYRPLERTLLIKTSIYESDRGVVSLVIYESENSERKKDMTNDSSSIYTYQFSEKTGSGLIPEQIFTKNYKETCAKYFTEYFEKNYQNDELNDGWQTYVEANEKNFNKYMVTDTGVTFFFDEGTILNKAQGVIPIGVSSANMGDSLRDEIKQRYIDPEKPMVAITYDDGPGGKSETRILDCLKKNGGVATFFYLGSSVEGNAHNLKTAYNMGCEIGNHTWNHPVLTTLSKKQVKKQITDTNNAIKAVTGADPTVFRPSYGETNTSVNKISKMPVIMWSVDTLDWKNRDGKKVFKAVKKVPDLDGKIILMHSIHDSTADATEHIVPWLKKKGYQMVTVSEMIKYKTDSDPKIAKVYR